VWWFSRGCDRLVRHIDGSICWCSLVFLTLLLGLEKKLEAREPARARSGSARLGEAREPKRARAEPNSVARYTNEPSRAGSVRLASRLGLDQARLGSVRLASLNEPEPSLIPWLATLTSRAEPAR
jgi:hypothetical protein